MTELRWWFGALAEIKLTAADTDGRMTILEVTEPPGAEAPLHVCTTARTRPSWCWRAR